MGFFEDFVNRLSGWFAWAAGGVLIGMMLLICGNIVTRLFERPIKGTFELVGFLLIIVISFTIAYGSLTRCHAAVDLLVRRLPQRSQAIIDSIIGIVSIGLFALIAWRCVVFSESLRLSGEVSLGLWIPFFPFLYAVALGFILGCLVILVDLFKSLAQAVRK